MVIPPTSSGSVSPKDEYDQYDLDQAKADQMLAAAASGNTLEATRLCNELGLGWMSYEIERLANASKKYNILETSCDTVGSALNQHQEDGVLAINADQKRLLESALMEMAKDGKPMQANVYEVNKKVMNSESINSVEAKNLYQWTLESKEVVIPSEFRIKAIDAQLQELRDQWQKKKNFIGQEYDVHTVKS
jgi:tRNA nucleotidyltransferase/poly(A) polymerase